MEENIQSEKMKMDLKKILTVSGIKRSADGKLPGNCEEKAGDLKIPCMIRLEKKKVCSQTPPDPS